jgi:hypothetical protein
LDPKQGNAPANMRGDQEHQGGRDRWIVWWQHTHWTPLSPWPHRWRTKGLAGALAMASINVTRHANGQGIRQIAVIEHNDGVNQIP